MSRRADRWGDDDELPRRPRGRGGMSPVASVLLVVGGVFLVGGLACGGLMWVGYRQAQDARAAARDARAAAREAEQAEAERQIAEIGQALRKQRDQFQHPL